jgi:hypothetical protein
MKIMTWNCQRPGRDLNKASPEYKSEDFYRFVRQLGMWVLREI